MWRRSLLTAVVFAYSTAHAAPATSATVHVQLFPLTGEVRLLNRDSAPIPIIFYQITSPAGALNAAAWSSITATYDSPSGPTPGNGLIDPVGQWHILGSSPSELTEAVFMGAGGSLPATRAISLGQIWDPGAVPFPDLAFDIQGDQGPIAVTVDLTLDGDYSFSQSVDQADYVLWRRYLDSTTMLLADGDLNGVVDLADYLIWRQNFGVELPLPPYGAGSGGHSNSLPVDVIAAPEPASMALAIIALGWLATCARRGATGDWLNLRSPRSKLCLSRSRETFC
jgi:hypothetical protein